MQTTIERSEVQTYETLLKFLPMLSASSIVAFTVAMLLVWNMMELPMVLVIAAILIIGCIEVGGFFVLRMTWRAKLAEARSRLDGGGGGIASLEDRLG